MSQEQIINLIIAVLGLLAVSTLLIVVRINIKKQKDKAVFKQKVKQRTKGDNSPAINVGHRYK